MISIKTLEGLIAVNSFALIMANVIWAAIHRHLHHLHSESGDTRSFFHVAAERSFFQIAAMLILLILVRKS